MYQDYLLYQDTSSSSRFYTSIGSRIFYSIPTEIPGSISGCRF